MIQKLWRRICDWCFQKWRPRPAVEYVPATTDDEKEILAKRLTDAKSRLHRLEWEADVIRRKKDVPNV